MTRPLRLGGALTVVLSLWLRWYEVRIPDQVRDALGAPNAQMPPGFAAFARGLLAALPASIGLTGWQAFQGADVALALVAGAVAVSVLLEVDARAILAAGVALAGLVAVHMINKPGVDAYATLKPGPWIALAGATAIALSAWSEMASPAPRPLSDPWAPPPAPSDAWAPPPQASVPPPIP